jgi:hypothetical protein
VQLDLQWCAQLGGEQVDGVFTQDRLGFDLPRSAGFQQPVDVLGDDREFGKNRTLSFASSCNQFIVFSMDERKWRKLFDKQIGIL